MFSRHLGKGDKLKNAEYWRGRFKALEDEQYKKSSEYIEDVERQFRRAQTAIQSDIEKWYYRLAENNDISYMSAKKLLKKDELEEFHWDVETYIKYGKENGINQKWVKELENASAKAHINRLEAIKLQLQQEAEKLYQEYHGGITDFLGKSYPDRFYHTAYEVAKGSGIGHSLAKIDTRKIEIVLTRPWAQDKVNFSDRIWANKDKLINTLHTELVQNVIRGEDPYKAVEAVSKKLNVSKNQAGTLVYTESAAIAAAAQKDCFQELGVEEFEIVATLDSITSEICRKMDGKHFPMEDYEVGITAPPFHCNCRSVTCPYFNDEFSGGGKRAARGEDGRTYYVPADITYPEWKEKYVNKEDKISGESGKSGLTPSVNDSNIKTEGEKKPSEYQRYGRNKETTVNSTYINSGEYRNKFDHITDNPSINRALYSKAKEMLKHRSGTMLEDMYWMDSSTGRIVASTLDQKKEGKIIYSPALRKKLKKSNKLIAMHTHPQSMPPSIADFNSAFRHEYSIGIIICHDGTVYAYRSGQEVNERLYARYISYFLLEGCTDNEAQYRALSRLKENHDIDFWEVK